jgi:hypothetical protein
VAVVCKKERGEISVKPLGMVLVVLGLGIVIWGAFGFRTREKVLDVGPIHATKEKEHNVPYGPLLGGVIVLGGALLLIKGKG